jgi:uncharacterized protein (DUF1800 family)
MPVSLSASSSHLAPTASYDYPRPTPGQASRFLAQATFGATPAEIDCVVEQGYEAWLDMQLALPPPQTHFDWLLSRGANHDANKGNGINALLDSTLWRQFITAPAQVRVRAAFALSEIYVVGISAITAYWPLFGAASYMDVLTEHALGNFRELLEAVTLNFAMGCMLTHRGNRREDNHTGRRPDENYAREIMQLFTIGLYELHQDGRLKFSQGKPIETYTNDDVEGLAKVFTGWGKNGKDDDVESYRRPMRLNPQHHSLSAKRFLGITIPAGTGGVASLHQALDVLCGHDNVAPFIGTQLIQRFVTSNPSPAYVARVAAVFNRDDQGVRGNLKAVIKAILLDREARFPDLASPTWGKVREPILRFTAWARAFDAKSTNEAWAMPDTTDNTIRLAQSPMRSPSVFNFFRPHYRPPASAIAAAGLMAPELQIVDETSVAGYLNFLAIYVDRGWQDLQTQYAAEIAIAAHTETLVTHIVLLLAGDSFNPHTAASIAQAVRTIPAERSLDRVRAAITLVAATPDYLVQR